MACAMAYVPDEPSLESKSLSVVCSGYVGGFCQFHEGCPMNSTHCIRLIDETPLPPPAASCMWRNVLTLEPRNAPYNKEAYFDNDGPGILSSVQDARHDNDHVLIQDIRILPTTDEVSQRFQLALMVRLTCHNTDPVTPTSVYANESS